MKSLVTLLTMLSVVVAAPTIVVAGTCYLDDPFSATPLSSPLQAGGVGNDFGGSPTLCGHEVHGTNCVLDVAIDSTGSASADCLSIGGGVTVNFNNHYLTCSAASQCGKAINITSSGSGGSKVVLLDVIIEGCWTNGAYGAGSFSEIDNATIDCSALGSCPSDGDYGVGGSGGGYFKSVTHSQVGRCENVGIVGSSITTVTDSRASECGAGFTCLSSGAASTSLVNILAHTNDYNVRRLDTPGTKCSLESSVTFSPTICDIGNQAGNCNTANTDFTFTSNFISNVITP